MHNFYLNDGARCFSMNKRSLFIATFIGAHFCAVHAMENRGIKRKREDTAMLYQKEQKIDVSVNPSVSQNGAIPSYFCYAKDFYLRHLRMITPVKGKKACYEMNYPE
jgi:hypothetical protein